MIATAESCTGGLVAAALTSLAGSSDVFERGFVTYANAAKVELLDVPASLLAAEGAVSEAVARCMAEGALRHSPADLAVAVTGIAGPGGGSESKPVGTVYVAIADAAGARVMHRRFLGDRARIRVFTTQMALDLLRRRIEGRLLGPRAE